MRGVKIIVGLVQPLAFLIAFAVTAGAADDSPIGYWLTDKQDGIVEIESCGDDLCGYARAILSAPEPNKPLVDGYNEDARLRSRPLCGLPIMGNLRRLSADTWGDGWVYDPHRGKTYDLEITLKQPDVLSLRGYIGVKLVGQTVVWTRARPGFTRCQ